LLTCCITQFNKNSEEVERDWMNVEEEEEEEEEEGDGGGGGGGDDEKSWGNGRACVLVFGVVGNKQNTAIFFQL
jgi:hypothetical protein